MFDQLIITLVSVAAGTTLTIVVNYSAHIMNKKSENKKVVREKIEETYALTFAIQSSVAIIRENIKTGKECEKHKELASTTNKFYMLTNLYTPSIKDQAETYVFSIRMIEDYCSDKGDNERPSLVEFHGMKIEDVFKDYYRYQINLHDSLARLLKNTF